MSGFYDTAKRMYKSSETLHNSGEYHNACYMGGYVIECYSKIIVGLAYGFTDNEWAKEFSHNLKDLNKQLQYILSNSQVYSQYIVDMNIQFSTIVSGSSKWHPNKRYSINSACWNQANSADFQQQIYSAMQHLTQMHLDGYSLI